MAEYVCEVVTEHELCGDVHHYVRRERVVRCRDCVNSFSHIGSLCCGNFSNLEDGHYEVVTPEGFCAWGEPMEGDE